MLNYIAHRVILTIPFLFLISIVSFVVIQLPRQLRRQLHVTTLEAQGGTVNADQKAALVALYGLDKPGPVQYALWITNIVFHGNFGNSFLYKRPVADILVERIPVTVAISVAAILFTWLFALPLGILAAVKQYSIEDHLLTFISLIGLAVPSFLLALVLMFAVYNKTGWLVNGLFSAPYRSAPWSLDRFVDMLKNVWLPILVLSVTGMAAIIRILRASLLGTTKKQYVTTARAKGLPEWQIILRYPLRIAVNPLISTIGWMLPAVVGGEIVAQGAEHADNWTVLLAGFPCAGHVSGRRDRDDTECAYGCRDAGVGHPAGDERSAHSVYVMTSLQNCEMVDGKSQPATTPGSSSVPTMQPPSRPAHYVDRRAAVLLKHYSRDKEQRHQMAQKLYGASQYQLMLVKFKKHRIATLSVFVLAVMYLIAIFAEFIAP